MAIADARLSVGFPTHPKTKKLIRRIGPAGAWSLVCLILWTAQNKPNGELSGMDDEEIEDAANWQGDLGSFAAALREVGFLDGEPLQSSLHDWEQHNPWAAGWVRRSLSSTRAALKKTSMSDDDIEKALKRKEKSLCGTSAVRVRQVCAPHAPDTKPLSPASACTASALPLPFRVTAAAAAAATSAAPSGVPAPEQPAAQQALLPAADKPPPAPRKRRANGHESTSGTLVWNAYSAAYLTRYGTEPVRNAKGSSLCAQFAQRLPAAEAPLVAAFFVGHPLAFYAQRGHQLELLVRDAEKLRTEWATNSRITETRARQDDATGAHAQLIADLKGMHHGK